ncbi:MAG: FtsB family cell division protein [Asticcacaulis sp.]
MLFAKVRPYVPTIVLALLSVYFVVQALTGDRGLLTEEARAKTLEARKAELAAVQAERRDLEARVTYLRDDNLSRDLLDERARVLLGFSAQGEYVIRLQNKTSANS